MIGNPSLDPQWSKFPGESPDHGEHPLNEKMRMRQSGGRVYQSPVREVTPDDIALMTDEKAIYDLVAKAAMWFPKTPDKVLEAWAKEGDARGEDHPRVLILEAAYMRLLELEAK